MANCLGCTLQTCSSSIQVPLLSHSSISWHALLHVDVYSRIKVLTYNKKIAFNHFCTAKWWKTLSNVSLRIWEIFQLPTMSNQSKVYFSKTYLSWTGFGKFTVQFESHVSGPIRGRKPTAQSVAISKLCCSFMTFLSGYCMGARVQYLLNFSKNNFRLQ